MLTRAGLKPLSSIRGVTVLFPAAPERVLIKHAVKLSSRYLVEVKAHGVLTEGFINADPHPLKHGSEKEGVRKECL